MRQVENLRATAENSLKANALNSISWCVLLVLLFFGIGEIK